MDEFGAVAASFPVPDTAGLGTYALVINMKEDGCAVERVRGAGVSQARVRGSYRLVWPAPPKSGREAVVTVRARYYFGQPVANGRVHWTLTRQPYTSPFKWDEGFEDSGGATGH
ncbi:MAG: hypothetical protein R2712_11430 [Vicinamibacterales bacterium]